MPSPPNNYDSRLHVWVDAGVLDPEAAERIRAFEAGRKPEPGAVAGLRWPVVLASAFGALLLGAGVLLFVSAHWEGLGPGARFALVLMLVAGFHIAGSATATGFPVLSTTLHTVGTIALGAGIFLAGRIFHLEEHWPTGLLLWALGAAAGFAILRDWPHLVLIALLAPGWLVGEWADAASRWPRPDVGRIPAVGIALLALTYFTALRRESDGSYRRALLMVGGFAILPASAMLAAASKFAPHSEVALPLSLRLVGWIAAIGIPLAVAAALRGREAWPNAAAAIWVLALIAIRSGGYTALTFVWWGAGAVALVVWGLREARVERINIGSILFAATVLAFYFSQVLDKLGRAASLFGMGLLFLAGGWAFERARRRLVLSVREGRT